MGSAVLACRGTVRLVLAHYGSIGAFGSGMEMQGKYGRVMAVMEEGDISG